MTEWEVVLPEDVDHWFGELCMTDPESADLVEAAIDMLVREGPDSDARS